MVEALEDYIVYSCQVFIPKPVPFATSSKNFSPPSKDSLYIQNHTIDRENCPVAKMVYSLAIIIVLELPPKLSLSSQVSTLSRYGTKRPDRFLKVGEQLRFNSSLDESRPCGDPLVDPVKFSWLANVDWFAVTDTSHYTRYITDAYITHYRVTAKLAIMS